MVKQRNSNKLTTIFQPTAYLEKEDTVTITGAILYITDNPLADMVLHLNTKRFD